MVSERATPAILLLTQMGIDFVTHTYRHDPRATSFGKEAAELLHISPERVFKTLLLSDSTTAYVAMVPVSSSVDLKLMAKAVNTSKVAMVEALDAQRITGYVVGGISPLAQRRSHLAILDESAILCETVLVSGGRRGLDVELAPDDLLRAANARYGQIARGTTP